MKQLLVFLLLSISIQSQNFKEVELIVSNYQRYSSVNELANQINKDFSTDLNKARAVYVWLAKNIRYDLAEFYNPKKRAYRFKYSTEVEKEQKLQALKNALVKKTFLTKKGVCEEYAQSFKKICDVLEIESEVIKGNVRTSTKQINTISKTTNHAWNAVKIDGNWMIVDATWGSGYETNSRWKRDFNPYFFDIPKATIFKTHLPEKSIWILRFGRITKQEFYNQPIYSNHFLTNKIELISPTKGVIQLQRNKNIELEFKNLNSQVFYAFSKSRFVKKAAIKELENKKIVSIPNPQREDELIIFIDQKECLKFKVTL